jgi:hypothetical protein
MAANMAAVAFGAEVFDDPAFEPEIRDRWFDNSSIGNVRIDLLTSYFESDSKLLVSSFFSQEESRFDFNSSAIDCKGHVDPPFGGNMLTLQSSRPISRRKRIFSEAFSKHELVFLGLEAAKSRNKKNKIRNLGILGLACCVHSGNWRFRPPVPYSKSKLCFETLDDARCIMMLRFDRGAVMNMTSLLGIPKWWVVQK